MNKKPYYKVVQSKQRLTTRVGMLNFCDLYALCLGEVLDPTQLQITHNLDLTHDLPSKSHKFLAS